MPITVTLIFADNTFMEPGLNVQLLDGGAVVATAATASDGIVTFDVDPSTLKSPAVNLAPEQKQPA